VQAGSTSSVAAQASLLSYFDAENNSSVAAQASLLSYFDAENGGTSVNIDQVVLGFSFLGISTQHKNFTPAAQD
jgi:preprotein translocase subunit Sec61beta